jgi:hypothetical protein
VSTDTRALSRAFMLSALVAVAAGCGGGGDGGGNGPLNITSTTVNDGVVGSDYDDTIDASGGKGARTFSITSGSLPDGLSMSSAGAITGTAAGPAGSFDFTVEVTDSANQPGTDTQAFTIDIVDPLAISTTVLAATSVGEDYNANIVVTGGTTPYTFTVAEPGQLPDGLSIDADGAIAGTVSADARSEVFTVEVTDSSSPELTATVDLEIDVTLEITSTGLPDATGGVPYSASFESQGGLLPLTWSLTAGTLPDGLTGPDPTTGEISGTPDPVCTASATALTVQVVDDDTPAQTDTQAAIGLDVNPAELDIANTMTSGVIDTPYNSSIVVLGGVPPYTFVLDSGSLPSGLSMNAAGLVTGTPDTIETQTFDVTVTDSCPDSVTESVTLAINDASLGRNDSIADATELPGDGTYSASISPSGDPNTELDPDEDYYSITTTAASTVTVDINAQVIGSPLDSVIEIVDQNGNQLNTCANSDDPPLCFDDDEVLGQQLDSLLTVQVGAGVTFYIHVVDFGSNARPDKLYDLVISGVN